MKTKLLAALLCTLPFSIHAEQVEFSEADANQDGALSTEEAQAALPEVVIVDTNNDGMLNLIEVESAIPGLMFPGSDEARESGLIGPTEYLHIVQVLEESGNSES